MRCQVWTVEKMDGDGEGDRVFYLCVWEETAKNIRG